VTRDDVVAALAATCVLLAGLCLTIGAAKGFTITKTLRVMWLGVVDSFHGRWPTGRSQ
jgi:hypothetical protein